MITNKVKLLTRENDSISRWLNDDDEDVIDNIMESLGIFRVNSFDAQVIRRDFIGMAEEAGLRGSSMKEVIGDDIRLTTYDIIRNSRGSNKSEIIFLYLKYLSGITLSLLALFGFCVDQSLSWTVNIFGLATLALSITMFFLLAKLIRPLLNTEGWGRFGFYWTMFTAISLTNPAYYTIISRFYIDKPKLFIPGWTVLLVFGLLYLIAQYGYLKTINNLAEDNSNYFEDLMEPED